MGYGGFRSFDRMLSIEIEEPLSWVLGLAAVAFAWGSWDILNPRFFVSPDFVAVFLGFVLHEAAHKLVAIRMGMKSEFIAYGPGLLITFLSGLVPFIIVLAPGYVRSIHTGWTHPKGFLYSVAAGPAVNIAIALGAAIILQFSPAYMAAYLRAILDLNAWFAFFNLLPVPPLDGSRIFRVTPTWWVVMLVSSILLLAL
ncbi:metalloprotease [Aeropyrum camini]|uniref:Zn-dependent protease n=1 Tax=Aeropyrum camini SY1 = JCM 12091 TaxID=1198449 RepID=U3THA1_9CREN|nr:metalloprotease [Aeropyrum camini]BAN90704.1 Zn-dependent protease [Aeropyrum camini SY1 = JCM 12091]